MCIKLWRIIPCKRRLLKIAQPRRKKRQAKGEKWDNHTQTWTSTRNDKKVSQNGRPAQKWEILRRNQNERPPREMEYSSHTEDREAKTVGNRSSCTAAKSYPAAGERVGQSKGRGKERQANGEKWDNCTQTWTSTRNDKKVSQNGRPTQKWEILRRNRNERPPREMEYSSHTEDREAKTVANRPSCTKTVGAERLRQWGQLGTEAKTVGNRPSCTAAKSYPAAGERVGQAKGRGKEIGYRQKNIGRDKNRSNWKMAESEENARRGTNRGGNQQDTEPNKEQLKARERKLEDELQLVRTIVASLSPRNLLEVTSNIKEMGKLKEPEDGWIFVDEGISRSEKLNKTKQQTPAGLTPKERCQLRNKFYPLAEEDMDSWPAGKENQDKKSQ